MLHNYRLFSKLPTKRFPSRSCSNTPDHKSIIDEFQRDPTVPKATKLISTLTTGNGNFDEIQQIYQHTIVSNKPTNDEFFTSMLGACWKFNNLPQAFTVLDHMQKRHQKPNNDAFKLLATMCVQANDPAAAERVVGILKRSREATLELSDCRNLMRALSDVRTSPSKEELSRWCLEALSLLDYMDNCKLQPDSMTYTFLLKACANAKNLEAGKWVHAHISKSGIQWSPFMQTALLSMYAKCGDLSAAEKYFTEVLSQKPNVEHWTAMISAYVQHNDLPKAFSLFSQMKQQGITPNQVTYLVLVTACTDSGDQQQGLELHREIQRSSVPASVPLFTALIKMYVKFKDVPTAFNLYELMKQLELIPSTATYASLLTACADKADLIKGRQLHEELKQSNVQLTPELYIALIDMYAKCGDQQHALELVDQMSKSGTKLDNTQYANLLNTFGGSADLATKVQEMLNNMKGSGA